MSSVRTVQLLDFEADADAGFLDWLELTNQTIVVAHTNKLLGCGRDSRGQLAIEHVLFDRITGLCLRDDGNLIVAANHELWLMTDALSPGDTSPTGADRWLMCRTARFVGGVRPADPFAVDDDCWLVSVTLSAVCSLDETFSARAPWGPS